MHFSKELKPHKCDNQLDENTSLKKKTDTDIQNKYLSILQWINVRVEMRRKLIMIFGKTVFKGSCYPQ